MRVLDPAAPTDPAELRIHGGRVVSLRRATARGPHDGLVVTPAFVDAHVHATATGLLVAVGANGEGKTNLLEGMHFLYALQSPRASASEPLVRHGAASGFVVALW